MRRDKGVDEMMEFWLKTNKALTSQRGMRASALLVVIREKSIKRIYYNTLFSPCLFFRINNSFPPFR
jgi:hypothetical protein